MYIDIVHIGIYWVALHEDARIKRASPVLVLPFCTRFLGSAGSHNTRVTYARHVRILSFLSLSFFLHSFLFFFLTAIREEEENISTDSRLVPLRSWRGHSGEILAAKAEDANEGGDM